MQRAEFADPRQNPPRAAQGQVGAPDLGPAAGAGDAARRFLHALEPGVARLVGQERFKTGLGGKEDLKWGVHPAP